MLKFSQINLHHCKEASTILSLCFAKENTNISLIQEPYFFKGKVRMLGNTGKTHWVQKSNESVRACIHISNDVNAILLKHLSDNDFVAIQVRFKAQGAEQTLVCCSAYLPYNSAVPTAAMIKAVDYCKAKG